MQKGGKTRPVRKSQAQPRPGAEKKMEPQPDTEAKYPGAGRLEGKVALITGGDSGIGRAVAVLFAREGADVAIGYLNEHDDAKETIRRVNEEGHACIAVAGDLSRQSTCRSLVARTVKKFGRIDVLVNNAALHWETKEFEDITSDQLTRTFANNVFSYFWVTQAALPHMKAGSCIINTTSVTAYRGSPSLIDYASTKGAIVSFTRSLSGNLVKKKIRVNGVAPGPIWTPLIASTFKPDKVAKFGSDVPMERAGDPSEVAPAFLFLACQDAAYITGQVIHPNGGEIING